MEEVEEVPPPEPDEDPEDPVEFIPAEEGIDNSPVTLLLNFCGACSWSSDTEWKMLFLLTGMSLQLTALSPFIHSSRIRSESKCKWNELGFEGRMHLKLGFFFFKFFLFFYFLLTFFL